MKSDISAKEIIHDLYNDLAQQQQEGTKEMQEVLLKVYKRLDKGDNVSLINRLVNYIYFTSVTNRITLSVYQNEQVSKLAEVGKVAGLNGVYRSDYGDPNQF